MITSKILIIEDEVALAKAVAIVCQRLGVDTMLCASGKRGLQELETGKFSLVVLDIGLPDCLMDQPFIERSSLIEAEEGVGV